MYEALNNGASYPVWLVPVLLIGAVSGVVILILWYIGRTK